MSTYFALIPSGILENENISDGAKITYSLILGLANRFGFCFATNLYLTQQRKKSESAIRAHLMELKKEGAIIVEYNERNDRRIRPIIIPTPTEKALKTSKNKQYNPDWNEIDAALDKVWKAMN